ncbi:MAG: serine/threonine protein kinase, partial [Deltaproteobacteria bacterium]
MAAEQFGKYQLLHKLASGGMGEVWLARQSGPAGFDRFVAVKRLLPNLAENNEFVQMFLDEARLVARLNHPNICQVFEFGCEKGSYYLAMEYMHGESLGSVLERSIKEKKPIAASLSAYLLAEACEGLHYAHERKDDSGVSLGLVHRDISPSNVFVTYDGNVKLLDFGIAKAAHRLTQTVAGAVKGKFGYIAPEVYRGATIDRRVDVFALGVVLWEMLAKKRLFRRETEYETLRAIVDEPTPDPRDANPAIPEGLAQIALRALEKEPADRYQTALEMRRAIVNQLRSFQGELDATSVAAMMEGVYGQVWIDLRSSVLDSFKESSDI